MLPRVVAHFSSSSYLKSLKLPILALTHILNLLLLYWGFFSAQYFGSREINKLYVLTANSATLHTFTSHPVCVLLTFPKTCPELTVQSTSVLTFCKLMIKVLSLPACSKSYLRAGRLVWDIKDYIKTLTPGSKLKFKWRHSKQTNTF